MRRWKCTICNYVHEGDPPPEKCPICNAPASKFVEIESTQVKAVPVEAAKDVRPVKPVPKTLRDFIKAFMVKHHLHPVSVHFPNGILPVVVGFFILSLIFDSAGMAKAGVYNLVFVLLSLPLVIFAGFVEWEKKYNSALTIMFQVKIIAAAITTVSCIVSLVWFLVQPDVLSSSKAWIFIGLNLVMLGCAGIAGFIGGKLVFKD